MPFLFSALSRENKEEKNRLLRFTFREGTSRMGDRPRLVSAATERKRKGLTIVSHEAAHGNRSVKPPKSEGRERGALALPFLRGNWGERKKRRGNQTSVVHELFRFREKRRLPGKEEKLRMLLAPSSISERQEKGTGLRSFLNATSEGKGCTRAPIFFVQQLIQAGEEKLLISRRELLKEGKLKDGFDFLHFGEEGGKNLQLY